jgi:hypothetical protein
MALMSWATHVLQWPVQSVAKRRRTSKPQKAGHSPDWSLKPDSMKLESLVIAYQHDAVNTFPGLVHTARHTTRVGCTRSQLLNLTTKHIEAIYTMHYSVRMVSNNCLVRLVVRRALPKVCLVRGVKS